MRDLQSLIEANNQRAAEMAQDRADCRRLAYERELQRMHRNALDFCAAQTRTKARAEQSAGY